MLDIKRKLKRLLRLIKDVFSTDDEHFRRVVGKSYIIVSWPRFVKFKNKNNHNNNIENCHKDSPTIATLNKANIASTKCSINEKIHNKSETYKPSDVIINPLKESPNSLKNCLDKIPKT